jgi:hypothetical protein
VHRANVAIFLTAVGLIGAAPMILLVVYALRRRADRYHPAGAGAGRSPVLGVVVVTGILLVGGGSAAWVLSARGLGATSSASMGDMSGMDGIPSGATPLPVPDRLAGLPLTSSVTGSEAIREVAAIHGSTFPVRAAVVATYADGRATIWVSRAPDPATAAAQVAEMMEGIARGTSPFTEPHELPGVAGVFATSGMGQRHYFFARGDVVWWIASDPSLGRRILSETLEVAA